MRWEPCPLIDGAYSDDAKPWSSQDTVNWLPTPAEQAGTRSPWMLQTPPGLVEFCDLGTGRPIRGAHDVEGLLLVVSGTTLFRVNPDGTSTSLGTIPGVERVSMDHTPRGTGFHVGIANGQSGYVYDTVANTLTQITDAGFPGASIFQFIDGYLAFLEPFGKFWGHSELNDALSYNTLDRYTAESAPDGIVSLIVSHREVFTPGTRSGEFFRNTGAATGTFQRADGYEMERGCASTFAIARLDNTVYWLGEDGIVYRLEGHQPVRVSTGPIEQAVARCNLANAFAFTWEDKGHKVFYLTFPDGFTWGYDAWTNKWHRRQSYGLNRWRLSTMTRWNRQWIAGDYTNGKLYTVSWDEDAVHENGEPMVSEHTFPVAHDYCNDLIINGLRLLFDTGRGMGDIGNLGIMGSLADAFLGGVPVGSYTASGGLPGYTFAVIGGDFPDGWTLGSNGVPTGNATVSGTYTFTVQVRDSLGQVATLEDTVQIVSFMDVSLDDDPLYYYRLDEPSGSSAADIAGLIPALNGTLLNSPTHGTPGLITGDPDTAMTFNGTTQKIQVPDNARLDTPQYTIRVLLNPTTIAGGVRHICNRDHGIGTLRIFQLRQNNAALELTVFDGVPNSYGITVPGFFVAGQRVLIHARVNAATGEVDIYKNGVFATSGDFPALAYVADYGHTWFGEDGGISGGLFGGVADEPAFYGSLLSPARMLLQAQIAGLA